MAKVDKDAAPLTSKEAHALLASIRFSALATVLKDPEFAMLTALTFAGFRVDANGYANPLVRKRLADEATRNGDFSQKLRDLAAIAASAPPPAPRVDQPGSLASRPKPAFAPDSPDLAALQAYRSERDRLKRERDEEAQRRKAAELELTQSRLDALAAKVDQAEAEKDLARAKQRAERLDRKLRRAELSNTELRKAIGTQGPFQASSGHSGAPASRAKAPTLSSRDTVFIDAVRRQLDKPKAGVARQISADVLRFEPANVDALEINALASEAIGDRREAAASWKALLTLQVGRGQFDESVTTLERLMAAEPDVKSAKLYFAALSQSGENLEPIRARLEQTRAAKPEVYQLIREAAQGGVATSLFAERSRRRIGPDDALVVTGLGLPRTVTARMIVGWINTNKVAEVDALRKALATVSDEDSASIADALAAATDEDGAYVRLLTRPRLNGPAIMDASNVAWHGQEMIASPKPRMSHILEIRRTMRARGFFPSLLIADANLPFVVDDGVLARQMIATGEIMLVTGGTDADEYILREARRLNAPIVTNDYMADWDPNQEVAKLQYSIGHANGKGSIYE